MSIVTDASELNLATSGKLKLRATARLAEGRPAATFEACVLLHEAARAERRAIEALAGYPPSTRLAASIEECWCLVEGLDPQRAAGAWGRVLREKEHVDAPTAEAMLVRLAPRFAESDHRFKKRLAGMTALARARGAGSLVPATAAAQSAIHREVKQVLDAFPGATSFWWASYRLLEAQNDNKGAWTALANARLLDPENRRFEAMSLLLSTRALPEKAADEYLGRVRGSFDDVGAEICLMYALAEIELAKTSRPEERWTRALDAANAGLTQAPSEGLRKSLKATQLLLDALLSGQEPTLDILYLAGLGESAAVAQPRGNVRDLVTRLASLRVAANETLDHAA